MVDKSFTRRSVLKATGGVAVTTVGLSALAGSAAAHFPEDLNIAVKPSSDESPINPRSHGVTSVAVLQTKAFNPTAEPVRYRFGAPDVVANGGGATPVHSTVRDVNGDGTDDLVLKFRTDETGFTHDDEAAVLRWHRDESGEHGLSGSDDIRTVGGRGKNRGREKNP